MRATRRRWCRRSAAAARRRFSTRPSSSPRPTRRIARARSCTRSGWTHHSHSVQLIHAAAMLQLLLGNIGRPGGGVNALRGHANIQGGTDCGVAYHNLPGYIPIPKADHETLDAFVAAVTPKPLRDGVDQLLVEHRPLRRQPAQGVLRRCRHAGERLRLRAPSAAAAGRRRRLRELELGLHLRSHVPRRDGRVLQLRHEPGEQRPALAEGHRRRSSKLKWLVVAENFEQETATFWRDDIQALVDKKPEDVQTEVFLLPAANFAEKDGSFVNSARWIQWKWKAVDPPGEAKPDQEIIARIFLKVRELYEREGGVYPEPIRALNWWYFESGQSVARRGRARRSTAGRSADVARRSRRRHAARRAAAARASPISAPMGRRCRATGSTSACTPTRATSRSADRPPIRAASAASRSGRSAGRPTGAFSTTAAQRTPTAGRGIRHARGSRGPARAGPATCPTSPPTARRRPASARS